MLEEFVRTRTAQDILLGRVRITLADSQYTLPVLASGPNARWREGLEARFAALLSGVTEAGNDLTAVYSLLGTAMPDVKAALFAYDQSGVLPSAEALDELVTDVGYLLALLEVWSAANPLAAIALGLMGAPSTSASSAPMNSPPSAGAGIPATSPSASPTSSSSPTSTPQPTASSPSSARESTSSAPVPSSPTTARRTSAGATRGPLPNQGRVGAASKARRSNAPSGTSTAATPTS